MKSVLIVQYYIVHVYPIIFHFSRMVMKITTVYSFKHKTQGRRVPRVIAKITFLLLTLSIAQLC